MNQKKLAMTCRFKHNKLNNMTFEEVEKLVVAWGYEKGIIFRGNEKKQMCKTFAEFGELSDEVLKNNREKIKDEAGDVLVTLCLQASMQGFSLSDSFFNLCYNGEDETDCLLSILDSISYCSNRLHSLSSLQCAGAISKWDMQTIVESLCNLLQHYQLTPAECLEFAYNKISTRKGKTIDGTYIKEE